MNLQEHQPLPKLWLQSFAVANMALPKMLVILIIYVIISFGIGWAIKALAPDLVIMLLPLLRSKIMLWAVALLIWSAFMFFWNIFFTTGILVSSQVAENKSHYLLETFFDSLKPAFWLLLANILLLVTYIPIIFAMRYSKILGIAIIIIMTLLIYIRVIYTLGLISIKGNGVVEGISNSWQMTKGKKYIDAFLLSLMTGATYWLYRGLSYVVFKVLYTQIPLHAADFFDLSKSAIGWIMLVTLLGLIFFFCMCQILTFFVMTFLNRYYTIMGTPLSVWEAKAPISVPLPNLNPSQLPEEHVNEGLPPDTDRIAQQKSAAAAATQQTDQSAPNEMEGMTPLGNQQLVPAHPEANVNTELDILGITQSSINTNEVDANEITQHLHQVYKPSKEDVVQYGDEDRMPTILFDDEMAKQLENNALQQHPASKQNTDNPPPDDGPIKMSK